MQETHQKLSFEVSETVNTTNILSLYLFLSFAGFIREPLRAKRYVRAGDVDAGRAISALSRSTASEVEAETEKPME